MKIAWLNDQIKSCIVFIVLILPILILGIIGVIIVPDSDSIDKLGMWCFIFLSGAPICISLLLVCIYSVWRKVIKV